VSGITTFVIAISLVVAIGAIELSRTTIPGKVDSLRIANGLYALCFGVVPDCFCWVGPSWLGGRQSFNPASWLRAIAIAAE
jgi:hypothetical protein